MTTRVVPPNPDHAPKTWSRRHRPMVKNVVLATVIGASISAAGWMLTGAGEFFYILPVCIALAVIPWERFRATW